jgi:hypothetical protein
VVFIVRINWASLLVTALVVLVVVAVVFRVAMIRSLVTGIQTAPASA